MGSGLLVMVVLCLLVVALGLWLLVRGIRGKRVGISPHCRRCDFDLSGGTAARELLGQIFEQNTATDPRCPECGHKLRQGDSIRIGSFRRGWVRAVLGAVILGTGLLLLGSSVVGLTSTAATSKLAQSAPLWMLHWQLKSGNQNAVDATCREIVRRDQAALLNVADAASLMDGVLDAMTRRDIAWSASLISARDALEITRGTPLADDEWGRLMDRVIDNVTIQARGVIREGKKLPARALVAIAAGVKGDLLLSGRLVGLKVDGEPQTLAGRNNYSGRGLDATLSRDAKFDSLVSIVGGVGKHSVEFEWELSLSKNSMGQNLSSKTFTDVVEIQVAPATTQLIHPPSGKTIEDARTFVSVRQVTLWNSGSFGTSGMVDLSFSTDDIPAAFDVFVLVPSESGEPTRLRASTLIIKSGMYIMNDPGMRNNALWERLRSFETVDVLLKANPELAEQTLDLTECVEGEMLFKDVPVLAPAFSTGLTAPKPAAETNEFLLRAITTNFPAYPIREVLRSPESDTLIERIKAMKVTDEEARAILDKLLDVQAAAGDEKRWKLECGTVIQELMATGKATAEDTERYHKQIVTSFGLMAPVRAWEGKPSYVTLTHLPYRCAEQSDLTTEMNPVAIRVDGRGVAVTDTAIKRHLMVEDWRVGMCDQVMQRRISLPEFDQAGTHDVEVDYRVRVWKGGVEQVGAGTSLHEKVETLRVAVSVLEKDDPGIRLLKEEQTRQSLIECFQARNSVANVLRDSAGKVGLGGALYVSKAIDVPVAFHVFVRPVEATDASQDVAAGSLTLLRGTRNLGSSGMNFGTHRNYMKLQNPIDPPAWLTGAKLVMLVLRADVETAKDTFRDSETWAGEDIVIGPVTLTRGRVAQ